MDTLGVKRGKICVEYMFEYVQHEDKETNVWHEKKSFEQWEY